jgi:hypothetical protein
MSLNGERVTLVEHGELHDLDARPVDQLVETAAATKLIKLKSAAHSRLV